MKYNLIQYFTYFPSYHPPVMSQTGRLNRLFRLDIIDNSYRTSHWKTREEKRDRYICLLKAEVEYNSCTAPTAKNENNMYPQNIYSTSYSHLVVVWSVFWASFFWIAKCCHRCLLSFKSSVNGFSWTTGVSRKSYKHNIWHYHLIKLFGQVKATLAFIWSHASVHLKNESPTFTLLLNWEKYLSLDGCWMLRHVHLLAAGFVCMSFGAWRVVSSGYIKAVLLEAGACSCWSH